MRAAEALIAYTPADMEAWPTSGQVQVGPLNNPDWTPPFACTTGAAYTAWRGLEGRAMEVALLMVFHSLVLDAKLDPKDVDQAFQCIDEYQALTRFWPFIQFGAVW